MRKKKRILDESELEGPEESALGVEEGEISVLDSMDTDI